MKSRRKADGGPWPLDQAVVDRARNGDRDAFGQLAYEVSDRLYAVAFRILRDADLANDALQNALVTVWRNLPDLRDLDRFEAWSYRILVHAAYREARRRGRREETIRMISAGSPDSDGISHVWDRDEIERAFRSLSAEHRAVFVLHHYVGLPLVDVATTLAIPAGTARSRLHYAREALRGVLDPAAHPHLEEVVRA